MGCTSSYQRATNGVWTVARSWTRHKRGQFPIPELIHYAKNVREPESFDSHAVISSALGFNKRGVRSAQAAVTRLFMHIWTEMVSMQLRATRTREPYPDGVKLVRCHFTVHLLLGVS